MKILRSFWKLLALLVPIFTHPFRLILVLGNLTRCDAVIHSLCATRAVEALILLLTHTDTNILLAVTGALVNVSANVLSTPSLTDSDKTVIHLCGVLRRSSFKNLQLSTLVCQVLHNLLLHGMNNSTSKNENEGDFILIVGNIVRETLQELIDCAKELQDDDDGDEKESIYTQFITVGQLVLNLIEEN